MQGLLQFAESHAVWIVAGVLVVLGYAVIYLALRRTLEHTVEQLRGEWAQEISSLMIAARLEKKQLPEPVAAATTMATAPVQAAVAPPEEKRRVTPDTLLVIAAAVTAFLGKKVRIRSAKMLYSNESFNAWSQQGRAVVQASHNVAQRVR